MFSFESLVSAVGHLHKSAPDFEFHAMNTVLIKHLFLISTCLLKQTCLYQESRVTTDLY